MPRFATYDEGDEPIHGYKLVDFLGIGQFGEVWKAIDTASGRNAAVKIIDLSFSQNALKELRALKLVRNLNHPNLVPIYTARLIDKSNSEIGLDDAMANNMTGKPLKKLVIVMGLGERSLSGRLKMENPDGTLPQNARGIPQEELLGYMEGAAKGIDYLNKHDHMLGKDDGPIIHCDIKPDNMMIVGGEVQIADCGVAIIVSPDARQTRAAGSPAYSPPELTGNKPQRGTDQYSLAISYFEMRTGRLPFAEGLGPYEVMIIHAESRLDFSSPLLSPSERKVLNWATAKMPSERYPSCSDFIRQLRRASEGMQPLEPAKLSRASITPGSGVILTPVRESTSMRSTPMGGSDLGSAPFDGVDRPKSSPSSPPAPKLEGLRETGPVNAEQLIRVPGSTEQMPLKGNRRPLVPREKTMDSSSTVAFDPEKMPIPGPSKMESPVEAPPANPRGTMIQEAGVAYVAPSEADIRNLRKTEQAAIDPVQATPSINDNESVVDFLPASMDQIPPVAPAPVKATPSSADDQALKILRESPRPVKPGSSPGLPVNPDDPAGKQFPQGEMDTVVRNLVNTPANRSTPQPQSRSETPSPKSTTQKGGPQTQSPLGKSGPNIAPPEAEKPGTKPQMSPPFSGGSISQTIVPTGPDQAQSSEAPVGYKSRRKLSKSDLPDPVANPDDLIKTPEPVPEVPKWLQAQEEKKKNSNKKLMILGVAASLGLASAVGTYAVLNKPGTSDITPIDKSSGGDTKTPDTPFDEKQELAKVEEMLKPKNDGAVKQARAHVEGLKQAPADWVAKANRRIDDLAKTLLSADPEFTKAQLEAISQLGTVNTRPQIEDYFQKLSFQKFGERLRPLMVKELINRAKSNPALEQPTALVLRKFPSEAVDSETKQVIFPWYRQDLEKVQIEPLRLMLRKKEQPEVQKSLNDLDKKLDEDKAYFGPYWAPLTPELARLLETAKAWNAFKDNKNHEMFRQFLIEKEPEEPALMLAEYLDFLKGQPLDAKLAGDLRSLRTKVATWKDGNTLSDTVGQSLQQGLLNTIKSMLAKGKCRPEELLELCGEDRVGGWKDVALAESTGQYPESLELPADASPELRHYQQYVQGVLKKDPDKLVMAYADYAKGATGVLANPVRKDLALLALKKAYEGKIKPPADCILRDFRDLAIAEPPAAEFYVKTAAKLSQETDLVPAALAQTFSNTFTFPRERLAEAIQQLIANNQAKLAVMLAMKPSAARNDPKIEALIAEPLVVWTDEYTSSLQKSDDRKPVVELVARKLSEMQRDAGPGSGADGERITLARGRLLAANFLQLRSEVSQAWDDTRAVMTKIEANASANDLGYAALQAYGVIYIRYLDNSKNPKAKMNVPDEVELWSKLFDYAAKSLAKDPENYAANRAVATALGFVDSLPSIYWTVLDDAQKRVPSIVNFDRKDLKKEIVKHYSTALGKYPFKAGASHLYIAEIDFRRTSMGLVRGVFPSTEVETLLTSALTRLERAEKEGLEGKSRANSLRAAIYEDLAWQVPGSTGEGFNRAIDVYKDIVRNREEQKQKDPNDYTLLSDQVSLGRCQYRAAVFTTNQYSINDAIATLSDAVTQLKPLVEKPKGSFDANLPYAEGLYFLAMAKAHKGELEAAISDFESVTQVNGDSAIPFRSLAYIELSRLFNGTNPQKLDKILDLWSKMNSDTADFIKAISLSSSGKKQEAIQALNDLLIRISRAENPPYFPQATVLYQTTLFELSKLGDKSKRNELLQAIKDYPWRLTNKEKKMIASQD